MSKTISGKQNILTSRYGDYVVVTVEGSSDSVDAFLLTVDGSSDSVDAFLPLGKEYAEQFGITSPLVQVTPLRPASGLYLVTVTKTR